MEGLGGKGPVNNSQRVGENGLLEATLSASYTLEIRAHCMVSALLAATYKVQVSFGHVTPSKSSVIPTSTTHFNSQSHTPYCKMCML